MVYDSRFDASLDKPAMIYLGYLNLVWVLDEIQCYWNGKVKVLKNQVPEENVE